VESGTGLIFPGAAAGARSGLQLPEIRSPGRHPSPKAINYTCFMTMYTTENLNLKIKTLFNLIYICNDCAYRP
jgi:hypothetical protein